MSADAFPGDHTEPDLLSEAALRELEWQTIRQAHRRYAMNQLRDKAAQMARDYQRDLDSGKLTPNSPEEMRARARVESYADLVTTLTKLKGIL